MKSLPRVDTWTAAVLLVLVHLHCSVAWARVAHTCSVEDTTLRDDPYVSAV